MGGPSLPRQPPVDGQSDTTFTEYGVHRPLLEHKCESRQLASEYEGDVGFCKSKVCVVQDVLVVNTLDDVMRRLLLNPISDW